MKTKLMYFFSMLCMLGLFSACSDDDKVEPIGTEFDGVYKGTLDVDLDGTAVGADLPQKVYVTKVGENQIKMELKNFSFGAMVLGDISVDKCNVQKQGDNSCKFDGEQKLSLPMVGDCDVVMDGTITGEKLEMVINVKATQDGAAINVKVDFVGTKLASDQSSEAKITEFTFDNEKVTQQPVIDGTNITFIVADDIQPEVLAALVPTIKISDKATVSPASGVAQDFSSPVTYTVTSEDGIVTATYKVSVGGQATFYDFETWVPGEGQETSKNFYEVAGGWSSSNTGALFLKELLGLVDRYVVTQTDDAHSGKLAARIETLDSKGGFMFVPIPKVTTGTLFMGSFITDISNTLNSTKFGNPYSKKPLTLKGFYKYTPGAVFYRCESAATCDKAVEDPNSVDKCAINAVLYEVTDFDDESQYLTGVNVNDPKNEQIVAVAQLQDGSAKADWTPFELPFTYKKEYDPAKKYRFAIICSSSSDGDNFNGAPGSTLIVDDFEVIAE
ncbi:PCMD domain-containing protein [Parabacteroides goldsteinii]|jgi:hypothetical protein|uniref:PCMD domain-containing protein n=1 Tax=Parabacteroides goldsteinii TaxID=328812 RepID=UPI003AB41D7B